MTNLIPERKVVVQVRDFPPRLKDAIVSASQADGTNMNDVAVAVLADAFQVPFSPSGRRSPVAPGDGSDLTFLVPYLLRRKMKQAAAVNDVPVRDIVLSVLSSRFPA